MAAGFVGDEVLYDWEDDVGGVGLGVVEYPEDFLVLCLFILGGIGVGVAFVAVDVGDGVSFLGVSVGDGVEASTILASTATTAAATTSA